LTNLGLFSKSASWQNSNEMILNAFPGIPVLPGVVQLGMARHFAEFFLHRPVVLRTVKKIKFTHVITPGAQVRLTLEKAGENELAYKYTKGEHVCSSGVMCF